MSRRKERQLRTPNRFESLAIGGNIPHCHRHAHPQPRQGTVLIVILFPETGPKFFPGIEFNSFLVNAGKIVEFSNKSAVIITNPRFVSCCISYAQKMCRGDG